MESEQMNRNDMFHVDGMNDKPRKKGPGTYWIFVFVLLGITAILAIVYCIAGLTVHVSTSTGILPPVSATPAPQGEAKNPTKTETPEAVATPQPGSLAMPSLDGNAPDLSEYADSFVYNNPIPAIYAAVADSVVGVLNYRNITIGELNIMDVYGSGSGFIVSSDGYVLTNAHVIEGAEKVTVLFTDGDEVQAQVIGYDNDTDVAVLKIEKAGLKPLAIGDSDKCQVGEYVIAIGNPLDSTRLANTTTLGVISATARSITIDSNTNVYLQTDAAINFGNSGGPLINMYGQVIGMNSAKSVNAGYDAYGNALSAEGIGFALPINKVISVMELLISNGEIKRPAIGITVTTLTETYAAQLNLDITEGVYVASVVKDGPAYNADIHAGDVITAANGKHITEKDQLVDLIAGCTIGDTITVEVYREGETLTKTIILENKSAMDFNSIG